MTRGHRRFRLSAAFLAMVVVTSFELADGFGVLTNVYDPADLLANPVGIGLAVVVDVVTDRLTEGRRRGPAVTEPADRADRAPV